MVMSMPPFGGCFNIVYRNYIPMASSGSLVVNRFKCLCMSQALAVLRVLQEPIRTLR